MLQHGLVVEAGFDFFRGKILSYVLVFAEVFVEVFSLEPALHGVSLYPAVSGIPVCTFGNEGQKHSRAVNEAAGEVYVSHHLVRIYEELVDEVCGLVQNVIQGDGGIGENDPFHGGVGNIPFMPQRNIFESREAVALDEAGHAADSFGLYGVSLMGHSGGALLFRAEVFFCFPDFCPLEVADFQGHLGKNAGDDAEGSHVFCMVVTLYDLGSHDFRLQAQFLAYILFYEGIDIGIGAYGAGEFAYCHFIGSPFHAVNVS